MNNEQKPPSVPKKALWLVGGVGCLYLAIPAIVILVLLIVAASRMSAIQRIVNEPPAAKSRER